MHETVQPLIQKEVIQPEVIHTTVPVHEVHHYAASHHPTTTLPAVSMDEFKRNKGGKLGAVGGAERRVHEFEGCPQTVGDHVHREGEGHVHRGAENVTAGSSSSSSVSSASDTGRTGSAGLAKKPSIVEKLNPFGSAK